MDVMDLMRQVRHREAGFHTLLQALQQRMQLLELHLIEAQKAAGLPISIPAAPAIPPATLGLLSVGFVESTLSDIDLAQLGDMSHTDSMMHCQIKEEFDKVTTSFHLYLHYSSCSLFLLLVILFIYLVIVIILLLLFVIILLLFVIIYYHLSCYCHYIIIIYLNNSITTTIIYF